MIKTIKATVLCATAMACLSTLMATGCPSSVDPPDTGPAPEGDAETPPQGTEAAIEAWLTAASFKGTGWVCEPEVHTARSPSPHGQTKICSNTKVSTTAAGDVHPAGAANVKEIYMNDVVMGHAITLKLEDGVSNGSKWYFYEKVGAQTFANGKGKMSNSDGCSGCHAAAGSGAGFSGHDFVYSQVQ